MAAHAVCSRPESRESSSSALMSTLSGNRTRQLRRAVEKALAREAMETDEHVLAQRALVARQDPAVFINLLRDDDIALSGWSNQLARRQFLEMTALRLQNFVRNGPRMDSVAKMKLHHLRKRHLRKFMRQLRTIQELRMDVKAQAALYFIQTAPAMVKKIQHAKERLAKARSSSATKHQVLNILRTQQAEILATEATLSALEQAMATFVQDHPEEVRRARLIHNVSRRCTQIYI